MKFALNQRTVVGAISVAIALVAAARSALAVQESLDPELLARAEAAVRREVRRGAFPGAALVVGRGAAVVKSEGIGQVAPGGAPVNPNTTLYDLASLTKAIATTTAVMLLVEDGKLSLDAPVSRYLPEFTGGAKRQVTIRHLLTHTSGLPPGGSAGGAAPYLVWRRLIATPLKWQPGERVAYSDVGAIVLWAAAERAAGEPLEELLQRRVFRPLGMTSTRFRPSLPCRRCAPTTVNLRGLVHDPLARQLGGVAGHAGLFATAADVGRFAAMMANRGKVNGVRVLKSETIRQFTRRQPNADTRALGWDTPGRITAQGSAGRRISRRAFGHNGYTGTSLWVDPERGTWTVLLTNRTYEEGGARTTRMQALRRTIHDRVSEAADVAETD